MALAKIEHPEQLPKLACQFPTMAALAKHLGVSREWVRQLLRRQGCTGFRYGTRWSQKHTCPQCRGVKSYESQVCMSCHSKNHKVLVACDYCGRLREIQVSKLITNAKRCKHWYCSHTCRAAVLGKTYGFGAHPENRRKGLQSHPPLHDSEAVWQKHLETGYGAVRLGRLLGMPEGTVGVILWKMRKGEKQGGSIV